MTIPFITCFAEGRASLSYYLVYVQNKRETVFGDPVWCVHVMEGENNMSNTE
jgi:hypothetical protein